MKRIIASIVCLMLLLPAVFSLAEGQKDLSGTITISVPNATGATEAWQAVADGYMEKYPNVKVVVDLKPSSNYTDWVKAQFQSWAPDHYPVADIVVGNLAGSDKNDKTINYYDYAFEKSPYSDGTWADQLEFDLQTVNTSTGDWDVLSPVLTQVVWYYNADIFDKVGIQPPKTWDEFVEVCEKLQQAGYQPLAMAGDFQSFWELQIGWLVQILVDQTTRSQVNLVRAQPGDYCYDEDIDGKFVYNPEDPFNDVSTNVTFNSLRYWKGFVKDGTIRADTPGMKNVWTNLAKIFPKYAGGNNFYGTNMDGARTLFYQGKAPIYMDTSSFFGDYLNVMKSIDNDQAVKIGFGDDAVELKGLKKFNLKSFMTPSIEGEGVEAKARTIEGSTGFITAIKKDTAHNDLVVDFLMYFSSAEGFSKYINAMINAGGHIDGKPLIHGVKLEGELADMLGNLELTGSPHGTSTWLARGVGDNQEALRAWYTYSMDLLNGKITADEWAQKNQENQLKYVPEVLKAGNISMSDLDNPQNEPTGE